MTKRQPGALTSGLRDCCVEKVLVPVTKGDSVYLHKLYECWSS